MELRARPPHDDTSPRRARSRGWRSSVALPLALALLGFVAFAVTAFANRKSLQEVIAHTAERNDAMEAMLLIERVNTLLVGVEAGQRGFVFIDRITTLTFHRENLARLQALHDLLIAELGKVSGGHAELVARLDVLVARRIDQARRILDRYSADGTESERISAEEGTESLMALIRFELDRIRAEQAGRVQHHRQAVADVQRRTGRLSLVLPVLGILLLAAAGAWLAYERVRRDRAEAALRRVNVTLEQRVGRRTAQLEEALRQIQAFASELDRSIEAERRRLARELHDQFGQVATALRLIVLGVGKSGQPIPEATLREMVELIDEAIDVARRISAALRPPLLDDWGLAAAVEHFAGTLQRQSGLQITCDVTGDDALNADQANQLFRILQEATTNVLRHANATEMRIEAMPDGPSYQLAVSDNGVGPGTVRAGAAGLRNMEERAQLIGASFSFGPGERHGTRVVVRVPVVPAGG